LIASLYKHVSSACRSGVWLSSGYTLPLDTMSSIRSNKSSILTDIAAKFPLHRLRRTRKDSTASAISSSYIPYEVHRNTMAPAILRDPNVTNKLLEAILESPGGRRSLSRLARTCKAFSEPALNVLWRELDSLLPIIGLFPSKLMRKSRKPGLGLVRCLT
jgi:hypothetical protein